MATLGGTDFKLRSSTNNDPYAVLEFTATVAYRAGQMVARNDIVGVIVNTVAIGGTAVLVYKAAKIVVPCATVTTGNIAELAEGCKVYFQSIHGNVSDKSGGVLCGIVTTAPSSGDTEIEIHLDGMLKIVA